MSIITASLKHALPARFTEAIGRRSRNRTQAQTKSFTANRFEESDMRLDLIARVRAEIAAGTYETEDKLDVVADRMIRAMDGNCVPGRRGR